MSEETTPVDQFISFNLTREGLKIGMRILDEQESLAKLAKLIYSISTGKQNENIISTINDVPISDAGKKILFNTWTLLVNSDKKDEPSVRPSMVFKR
jgi:hypothetical protein